jgi:hypothetical protein
MSQEAFERLCCLRDLLVELGLESMIEALTAGDEASVEEALERMVG